LLQRIYHPAAIVKWLTYFRLFPFVGVKITARRGKSKKVVGALP
jgi:hypothetical protein